MTKKTLIGFLLLAAAVAGLTAQGKEQRYGVVSGPLTKSIDEKVDKFIAADGPRDYFSLFKDITSAQKITIPYYSWSEVQRMVRGDFNVASTEGMEKILGIIQNQKDFLFLTKSHWVYVTKSTTSQ